MMSPFVVTCLAATIMVLGLQPVNALAATGTAKLNDRFIWSGARVAQLQRQWDKPKAEAVDEMADDENIDPTKTPKIIGGQPTDISLYPHQLSLRLYGYHVCGASIIGEWWALSAAHCVFYNPIVQTVTFLSASTNKSAEDGYITQAEEYFFHPELDMSTYQYDIVVTRVLTPFIFSPNSKPIKLITQYTEFPTGLTVETAGWGFTEQAILPDILHRVELPIVDFDVCNEQWEGSIYDSMICAGRPGFDICSADNGGALIYCNLQIGITLFNGDGCNGSKPSVFADLANPKIRSFIRQITGI